MEKAAKVVATVFLVIPGVALWLGAMMAWRGYVLAILWGWFAVPAFGLPALSVPMAIGLAMVAGGFTGQKRSIDEVTDPEKKWMTRVAPFLSPLMALGIGWIVKQYV